MNKLIDYQLPNTPCKSNQLPMTVLVYVSLPTMFYLIYTLIPIVFGFMYKKKRKPSYIWSENL